MPRIEKTVFLSYRRTDGAWALSLYSWLTQHGYDVFIDYEGIASGAFATAITENILARAHFVVILSPTALDRCDEPRDWLRREIETAMQHGRNIVPVLIDGFSFRGPNVVAKLTGLLQHLAEYNALELTVGAFKDKMERLSDRFLNVALENVVHPPAIQAIQIDAVVHSASAEAIKVAKDQQAKAEAAPDSASQPVTPKKLGIVDPTADLKQRRSQTTDRDIAFLREATGKVTYPETLSRDSAARAPKGERWEAETQERANARARKLIELGLMEERGGGEVEISDLGRALVTDDDEVKAKRQKDGAGDSNELTRVAAEKAWDDVVLALGKLSELSNRHVKAVAEVAGPILTERNLLETSRRYSQLVNNPDFPAGYDEVKGILAATKTLSTFKATEIQTLIQKVDAQLTEFQLVAFTIRWDSHNVAGAVAEAARVASSGADVSPDDIARASQPFIELFTGLFQEPVPQLADPPTKDALVDLVQRWFQSWQRHVQRSLYGGVGLNSAIAQLKMQRHA